jgi:hypothetical protein
MTDEEIQRIAEETGTPEAVIRTALPLIPVDKHSEWIGLLKSDNPASKMAHSYGWTVGHAISYLRGTSPTSPPPKRSPLRFRFTIRDLLWLTALVAMSVGWWLERHSSNSWRSIRKADGSITLLNYNTRERVFVGADGNYATENLRK